MPGGISKQMPVSEWGKSFSNLYENDDFAERIKLCLDELTIEKTLKKGEKAVFLDPAGAQYFAEINESGNIKYKKAYSRRDYRMRYNQYIDNIKNSGIWPNYFSDEE